MAGLDDDSRTALVKLEYVKEIRQKLLGVERLRSRLASEVEAVQLEEASLAEYRSEVEQLLQEKMAHVEELRQIHADINAMENIIKTGEEIRSKSLDNARRLYEEYQPMKNEAARLVAMHMPRNLPLPALSNEDDPVPPSFFEKAGMEWPHESDELPGGALSMSHSGGLGLPSSLSGLPSLGSLGGSSSFLGHHQVPPMTPLRSPQKVDQRPLPPPPGPPAPTFRQQPPPMKSCLSCHQQIHRNAPICPLCKAKSRSRNPKKPKKKD